MGMTTGSDVATPEVTGLARTLCVRRLPPLLRWLPVRDKSAN